MKIIAFYLPQFHDIPENDKWWGKGFTEWVNVKKAQPLFPGHCQPRVPLNDNYYDLLDDDVKIWQANIAKEHGVYGFCYYHYWFSGKMLLEKPMEQMLANKKVDIPFCICWANVSWTKSWVNENKILIQQFYGDRKEWKEHFDYMLPFFKDDRYIKEEGKPLFVLYRPETVEHLNEMFGRKFPRNFRREHVSYRRDTPEELAIINYTSGTTSFSKGVMLPYRSLWSNTQFAFEVLPLQAGNRVVSMLPMAHMYGLAFEFLYEICCGCHVYFLTRMPSPKIIAQAFTDVKPHIVIAVPLIIEKIIKKGVLPKMETLKMKMLMKLPIINDKINEAVREQMVKGFGGQFYEIIVGGAAFNSEIETFLKGLDFPYTVGYGMTECGPIISYEDWKSFRPGSCGKAAPRMEIRIDSPDPQYTVGEILVRGDNVMLGYYKNPESTAQAIDKDGWLHTGDLGVMDAEGNLFIKGRSKNMLLGPSGQNIYPEEIEEQLNNLPYVAECIVIQQKDNKLAALVYPDFEAAYAQGMNEADIEKQMEENRLMLNAALPSYSQIAAVKIYPEEFEKTPKKSIKRFLYQDVK